MVKLLILLGVVVAVILYIVLMTKHLGKKENKPCKCEAKSNK